MSMLQNMEKIKSIDKLRRPSSIISLILDPRTNKLYGLDIDEFISVYKEFLEYMNTLYVRKRIYTDRDYKNAALNLLNNRETVTIAYVANNTILGFMNILFNVGNGSVRINEFFVMEKYRHMGIGTKLVQTLESSIMNDNHINKIVLSVNDNNELAKRFYINYGFKFI